MAQEATPRADRGKPGRITWTACIVKCDPVAVYAEAQFGELAFNFPAAVGTALQIDDPYSFECAQQ
jgi:hypothetical protein